MPFHYQLHDLEGSYIKWDHLYPPCRRVLWSRLMRQWQAPFYKFDSWLRLIYYISSPNPDSLGVEFIHSRLRTMKWSVHGHQWPFLLCLAVVARPNDGNQTKKGHTASMTLTLTLSSIRSMDAVESLWQYYCRILTTIITIILSVFVLFDRKIHAVYPSLPATIQWEQGSYNITQTENITTKLMRFVQTTLHCRSAVEI